MKIRLASVVAVTVIALSGVSGCGDASDCSLNACTVTFDGVDAEVSVLGVAAKVVKVEGDQVTLEVAGAQQVVTVGSRRWRWARSRRRCAVPARTRSW